MNKLKKRKKILNEIGHYTDVGLRFAITIIVFLFLGYWLDNKFGCKPALTIIFVFLGASVGFYNLYRTLVSHMKNNYEKKI